MSSLVSGVLIVEGTCGVVALLVSIVLEVLKYSVVSRVGIPLRLHIQL